MASSMKTQQMGLVDLTMQQLGELRNQVEQDLELFEQSLETLKSAQDKFMLSGACLENLLFGINQMIMIPLTSSLYVPGVICDNDSVIIDVGTGYFVNKSIETAKDYFKRKVDFLGGQIEAIQIIGAEKTTVRKSILETMKLKLQEEVEQNQFIAQTFL